MNGELSYGRKAIRLAVQPSHPAAKREEIINTSILVARTSGGVFYVQKNN